MKIIYHRIDYKNQNDVDMISINIENGITSFELDLQLAKDNIVIFHDSTLKKKGIYKNICDYSCEELKQLNISNIDDLCNVLGKYKNLDIFLDLKGANNKMLTFLYYKLPLLKRHSIYIQSFNHLYIDILKKLINYDYVKFGYIIHGYLSISWSQYLQSIDFICIDNQYLPLFIKGLDINIYIYNCNSYDEIKSNRKFISGIITDFPDHFNT